MKNNDKSKCFEQTQITTAIAAMCHELKLPSFFQAYMDQMKDPAFAVQNPSFSAWLFKVSAQRSETEGALASKNENTGFVAARAWCELVHRADLSTALKAAHPT